MAKYAQLVVAVERNDATAMKEALTDCGNCDELVPDDNEWKQPIPDAMEQAAAVQ